MDHQWLDDDVPEFASEFQQLKDGTLNPKLKKREQLDALGVLETLRGSAARGKLPVGPTEEFLSRTITTVGYLLELRPRFGKGRPPKRLVRLYYAEPASVDSALLPLVLSTKPSGPDVGHEQQKSIVDAQTRSRTWTLMKKMEAGS